MIKKVVKIFFIIFISLIIFYIIDLRYDLIPYKIKYRQKIKLGNIIARELDGYFLKNGNYPDDWEILESIYKKCYLEAKVKFNESWYHIPPYFEECNNEYSLRYSFGFDGPNLIYYSKIKEWAYGINIHSVEYYKNLIE